MKRIQIGDWMIDVDAELTASFYATCPPIVDTCGCLYCRNFFNACDALTKPVTDFFKTLGINPQKDVGEIYQLCVNDDGTHMYGGFYHIVGSIVEGQDCHVERPTGGYDMNLDNVHDELDFLVGFTTNLGLVRENFPTPALQVELALNVPWVLDESPDE